MNNKTEVVDKLERFLIDNKSIKLETMKEIYPFLKEIKEQLSIHVVSKRLFLCDICGEKKSGKKFPVLDENWNKQSGLNQCEDCFKDGCGID